MLADAKERLSHFPHMLSSGSAMLSQAGGYFLSLFLIYLFNPFTFIVISLCLLVVALLRYNSHTIQQSPHPILEHVHNLKKKPHLVSFSNHSPTLHPPACKQPLSDFLSL